MITSLKKALLGVAALISAPPANGKRSSECAGSPAPAAAAWNYNNFTKMNPF
jgi:hypothetical protein